MRLCMNNSEERFFIAFVTKRTQNSLRAAPITRRMRQISQRNRLQLEMIEKKSIAIWQTKWTWVMRSTSALHERINAIIEDNNGVAHRSVYFHMNVELVLLWAGWTALWLQFAYIQFVRLLACLPVTRQTEDGSTFRKPASCSPLDRYLNTRLPTVHSSHSSRLH